MKIRHTTIGETQRHRRNRSFYRCRHNCGRKFARTDGRDKHEERVHAPKFTGVKRSMVDDITPFRCGSCTATFRTEEWRDRHEAMFHPKAA